MLSYNLYSTHAAIMYKLYCVSDHTGLTSEAFAKTLLTQFEGLQSEFFTHPYVDTLEKADKLVQLLETQAQQHKILVFSSIVNPDIRACFSEKTFVYIDIFAAFLPQLETLFERPALRQTGRLHGMKDYHRYMDRIEAIHFSVAHDDGLRAKHYDKADIVLVGVSRSGKTPTCLYLAMQYGIRAANYPITEEDLLTDSFPSALIPHRNKLFGLMIDANRLSDIRQERLPDSRYASPVQCQKELHLVRQLFQRENIAYLETTNLSIEEIAAKMIIEKQLKKRF